MPRIIYLCPADNVPTGGIKVIYRHAALLSDLGAEAFVLHPFEASFRCDWFEHRARFLDSLTLHPSSDLVVIPELWAGIFGPQCLRQAVRYAVFVQNGYLTHPVLPQHSAALMEHVYRSADLVLAISDDSARMVTLNYPGIDQARVVRARYSVGERFLSPALLRGAPGRARAITFMPRKMADHAVRVVFALRQHLPAGWQIIPIANVNEAACAAMLFGSRIFLAFSEFEGLPLPPLEAALAGNLVIGYTGQGAREYWDAPNFQSIQQGEIGCFVSAAAQAARDMDARRLTDADLAPGIDRLVERFSPAAEAANLRTILDHVERCFARAPGGARAAELV
jgi:hypothetical protein